ncbi:hypothetical protein OXX79_001251 [Metschnikowia pulcherrima]
MSSRRLRQKIPSSDEESDAAPATAISDSEEISEAEFDDEAADDDHMEAEIDEFSEDNYEEEPVRPSRGSRPVRESKKRQLTFYEEDDLLESEDEAPPKKKVSVKLKIPRRVKKEEDFTTPEYKPDVSRMTERQRARLVDDDPSERYEDSMFARMDEQLLALNRKTQKKQETAEQMAVRKAENARKRADYKTRQLEGEKRDTLNKLLKRRANKTRERPEDEPDTKQTLKPRRPVIGHPALLRYVNSASGALLGIAE